MGITERPVTAKVTKKTEAGFRFYDPQTIE
jgi:hypothetical protein